MNMDQPNSQGDAQTHDSSHNTTEQPQVPPGDGLDLQVAMDGLAVGNTDGIKAYLARKMGINPDAAELRVSPWKAPQDDANVHLSYVGAIDNIQPPGSQRQLDQRNAFPNVDFSTGSGPFQYDAMDPSLRHFRLVRLAPADSKGVISEFQLQTFSLDHAPPFFCLSYVWGEPRRFLPVTCNGKTIKTTANLYHAMQTCFNRFPDIWLWADGLCINQEDITERGHQVKLMGNIFRLASMVVAHPGHYKYALVSELGNSDSPIAKVETSEGHDENTTSSPDSTPVPAGDQPKETPDLTRQMVSESDPESAPQSEESVQEALSMMKFLSRIWSSSPDYEIKSDTEWEKHELPEPSSEDGTRIWSGLQSFWEQDWFSRAWVLQEIALAAKVVVLYHETAISLDALVEFWTKAKKQGLPRTLRIGRFADACSRAVHLSPVASLDALRKQQPKSREQTTSDDEQTGRTSSLLDLLRLSRTNLATDGRDKVYSLLGLTDDDIARSIMPDYSAANTVSRLYIEVARRMIKAGLVADLLPQAGIDSRTPGLPSWVPDWSFQSRSALNTELYRCMGSTKPKTSISDLGDKPRLTLSGGAILSPISFVGPAWRYYSHDSSEAPFAPFANSNNLVIPPFNDEDARNFILTMALNTTEDSGITRYENEGWDSAVARTLATDCSWGGKRIGTKDNSEGIEHRLAADFHAAFDAFREFYAKGPNSEEDLTRPGVRVHQTCIFQWLLEFDEEKENELQKRMVPFTIGMQEAQRGRRFAVLGKGKAGGFVATVPWDAQKQDLVVIVKGFPTPLVLRKCQDTSETAGEEFQLIGDCYVHGAMDGELLQKAEELESSLSEDQILADETGQKYAFGTPEGYARFRDVTIR